MLRAQQGLSVGEHRLTLEFGVNFLGDLGRLRGKQNPRKSVPLLFAVVRVFSCRKRLSLIRRAPGFWAESGRP